MAAVLSAAGCVAADEEAEELVSRCPDRPTLEAWVRRRTGGEPLAWIVGSLRFLGADLRVDPGVYVPRAQTEELAVRAAGLLPGGGRAADLCTGSGAVAAHLARTVAGAAVVGTDVDPVAAGCARRNGVPVVVGDLGSGLRSGSFDLVTAVAPYVPTAELPYLPADVLRYEPRRALDGGPDGLAVLRRAVAAAARLLRPGGWLVAELGGDQDAAVAPALAAAGFGEAEFWYDEDGDLRGGAARLHRGPSAGARFPDSGSLDGRGPGT